MVSTCSKKKTPTSSGSGPYTGPTGALQGVVRAADGTTPIQGAVVTVEANYTNLPVDTSGLDGSYLLTGAPTGSQTILARKGLFLSRVTVNIIANDTVTATSLNLQSSGRLAYVVGAYDNIEAIVRDTLGNPMEEIMAESLGFVAVTGRYKAIFLNCGLDETPAYDTTTIQNLKEFVRKGGRLYASDWAETYVKEMFPSDIWAQRNGVSGNIWAKVVYTDLRNFVGKDTVEVDYDLGAWVSIDSLSVVPIVLLRGDYNTYGGMVTDRPLAVIINYGSGRIVFTTFHNHANVLTDAVKVLTYFIYTL